METVLGPRAGVLPMINSELPGSSVFGSVSLASAQIERAKIAKYPLHSDLRSVFPIRVCCPPVQCQTSSNCTKVGHPASNSPPYIVDPWTYASPTTSYFPGCFPATVFRST